MTAIAIVTHPRGEELSLAIADVLRADGLDCRYHVATGMADIERLEQVEVLLSFLVPCGAEEMDRMPRLRGIVSPLLGFDWIDLEEASRRGIAVTNSEVLENREGMAEATILLLLTLLYRLHETEALLRENASVDTARRHMLKGKTVGIIGYGGISRAVIARLQSWGCRFLVHSRAKSDSSPGVDFVPLEDLLSRSDVILVLTGLNPSTHHMLGAEQFGLVRPGTLLVNVARGAIIDEAALVEALKSGRIGAAALDVFEHEPLPAKHVLRQLPNVILTPHAIGHNEEAKLAAPKIAANNIVTLAQGDLPSSCQNKAAVLGVRQADQPFA